VLPVSLFAMKKRAVICLFSLAVVPELTKIVVLRPNLHYSVRLKPDNAAENVDQLANLLQTEFRGESEPGGIRIWKYCRCHSLLQK